MLSIDWLHPLNCAHWLINEWCTSTTNGNSQWHLGQDSGLFSLSLSLYLIRKSTTNLHLRVPRKNRKNGTGTLLTNPLQPRQTLLSAKVVRLSLIWLHGAAKHYPAETQSNQTWNLKAISTELCCVSLLPPTNHPSTPISPHTSECRRNLGWALFDSNHIHDSICSGQSTTTRNKMEKRKSQRKS